MNVQCHSCIGGTNVGEDIRKLDYGQHVVAGTPGRVFGKDYNKIDLSYDKVKTSAFLYSQYVNLYCCYAQI